MEIVANIFSIITAKVTRIPLPGVDPLEIYANIDVGDTWEAVERFPTCLLLTDPILSDESEDYTVKDVVFNIKSNDQGWTSEDNYEGEYEGSWTWFEVAILRPVKASIRISPRDKRSIASEPCVKKSLDETKNSDKLHFVIENGGPFWRLQRNRRGNREPKEHEIVWNRERQEVEDFDVEDFDAKTGEGSGIGFMKSVKKGDRVAIIARAKKSGAVNYISEAKIKINFEGFKPASSTLAAGSTPADLTQIAQLQTARSSASTPNASAGEPKTTIPAYDAKVNKSHKPSTQLAAVQMPLFASPLFEQLPLFVNLPLLQQHPLFQQQRRRGRKS